MVNTEGLQNNVKIIKDSEVRTFDKATPSSLCDSPTLQQHLDTSLSLSVDKGYYIFLINILYMYINFKNN